MKSQRERRSRRDGGGSCGDGHDDGHGDGHGTNPPRRFNGDRIRRESDRERYHPRGNDDGDENFHPDDRRRSDRQKYGRASAAPPRERDARDGNDDGRRATGYRRSSRDDAGGGRGRIDGGNRYERRPRPQSKVSRLAHSSGGAETALGVRDPTRTRGEKRSVRSEGRRRWSSGNDRRDCVTDEDEWERYVYSPPTGLRRIWNRIRNRDSDSDVRNGRGESSPGLELTQPRFRFRHRTVLSFILLSAVFAFASISYFILPTPPPSHFSQHQRHPLTVSDGDSAAAPTEKDLELFFRTGKLPARNQMRTAWSGNEDYQYHDGLSGRLPVIQQNPVPNYRGGGGGGAENVAPMSTAAISFTKPIPDSAFAQPDSLTPDRIALRRRRNRLLYGTNTFKSGMEGWPPFSDFIGDDGSIVDGTDLSDFLDFSIIGFAKSGTTSLLRHLSNQTDSLNGERCDLVVNSTAKLLKSIYDDRIRRLKYARRGEKDGTEAPTRPRGLKCPQDISSEWSLVNYAKHFPRTKLVVGLRHPVLWFESLYNFRVSNVPWKNMPHTSNLTKRCIPGSQGVCAWRANYHDFLSRMGKTPMLDNEERKLLRLGLQPVPPPGVGPVFLYELSQLADEEIDEASAMARSAIFRKDLTKFLRLETEIPPIPAVDTSGKFNFLSAIKRQTDKDKIDICHPEHSEIHATLMKKARKASHWIRNYMLKSEEVFVSQPSRFVDLLETWMHDPCVNLHTKV